MKKIHVIATSDKRILTVAYASDIPGLLKGQTIEGEWFYTQPKKLNEFLGKDEELILYFLKGFSYWIETKVKGLDEEKSQYEKLKRIIKEFNEELLEKLRGLATRIAKKIKQIIKTKKTIYEERRKEKRIYEKLTSKPIKFKHL